MHHKFVIADGSWVLTGSMNFTPTGMDKSHEGYIITDHPDIVGPYAGEFNRLWDSGRIVDKKELTARPPGGRGR